MEAGTKQALLIAGLVIVPVLAIPLFMLAMRKEPSTLTVSYESSLGKIFVNGEEYAPGDYELTQQTLTIEAVPNESAYFLGFLVDGISQGTNTTITLNLTEQLHLVSALFTSVPPNGNGTYIPSIILPLNSPVYTSNRVGCGVYQGLWDWTVTVRYYLIDWITEGQETVVASFRVEDSAGNPVGNIPVEIWTDDMPDSNDTGGILFVHNQVHTSGNPLTVWTLANGEAQVLLRYLPADKEVFAEQHNHVCNNLGFCACVGEDGWTSGGWAGARSIKNDCPGSSPDVPGNLLELPITHTVYAKVKDTVLTTIAVVNCKLEIKSI